MSKKEKQEEVKLDLTSMIDVIFLLIIFFILMPSKEMEGQLEAYLPNDKVTDLTSPPPPQPTVYTINIQSKPHGESEILTEVQFNNRHVCEFTTYSIPALDKIYSLPKLEKQAKLKSELSRDKQQFSPKFSPGIRLLISRMEQATFGTQDGMDTDIIINASGAVPFKIVLAILNAGAGADFTNLKFAKPSPDIWKQPTI